MIGQVAGNYRITEKLGEGGMGTVYKAVDVMVEREVAIKMLRPEIARRPEIVERFRAEAVTLAKLNHPSIATLFSFYRHGDEYFMAMEFVPGRTLDAVLRTQGPFPVEPAVRVMAKVLDGIDHAHKLGILHRDIKPANIMLTPAGAVKVTDFGIARVLGQARMTREGNIVGTLEYLAPERIRGQESDLRSDIYSLGAVLYEMLTGHVPFETDSEFELMRSHLEVAPQPVRTFQQNVPPAVETVVMKALAKSPDERFSTAAEFHAALLAALGSMAVDTLGVPASVKPTRLATVKETRLAQAPAPVASTARPRFTTKHYAIAAVVLVLLVAAIVAGALLGKKDARQDQKTEVKTEPVKPVTPPPPSPQPVESEASPPVSLPAEAPGQAAPGGSIKGALPVTGPIEALGDKPARKAPAKTPAEREAERRKAALRALGVGEEPAQTKSAPQPSEQDKRKSALKALER